MSRPCASAPAPKLLRQAAIAEGLLDGEDPAPLQGAISDDASTAIETLLDQALQLPEPPTRPAAATMPPTLPRYAHGERAQVRHRALRGDPGCRRQCACASAPKPCLLDLRCDARRRALRRAGQSTSNCPAVPTAVKLGWLRAEDCAPELAKEILGHAEIGVLPRLVPTRFGLHVVEVLAREAGTQPPYEAVRSAVAQALRQQAFATALRQYLQLLAGQADVRGVDLEAAASPLVQ